MNTYEKMIVDRIFPITHFNYCAMGSPGGRPESVKDWVDAGLTLGQTPNFRLDRHDKADMLAILDACSEHGIQAVVVDTRCNYPAFHNKGEKAFRAGLADAIADWGRHPATFGLEAGDEPHGEMIPAAHRTAAIHKEIAPHLTHFMSFGGYSPHGAEWMGLRSYRKYLDDFCQAAHPRFIHMNNGGGMLDDPDAFDIYFRATKMVADAAQRNDTRFWVTLLCAGHFTCKRPNEDQLRWQLNTAAASGAQGVGWFFLYMRKPHANYTDVPIDEHWQRTEHFARLSRVNRTFIKLHGPVITQLKLQRCFHVGRAFGGYPGTIDSELVKAARVRTGDFPLIVSEFVDPAARPYVAIVNNSHDRFGQAVLTFHGRPEIHQVAWEDTEQPAPRYVDDKNPANPAAMTAPWLAPGQMEVYRLEENHPPATKL